MFEISPDDWAKLGLDGLDDATAPRLRVDVDARLRMHAKYLGVALLDDAEFPGYIAWIDAEATTFADCVDFWRERAPDDGDFLPARYTEQVSLLDRVGLDAIRESYAPSNDDGVAQPGVVWQDDEALDRPIPEEQMITLADALMKVVGAASPDDEAVQAWVAGPVLQAEGWPTDPAQVELTQRRMKCALVAELDSAFGKERTNAAMVEMDVLRRLGDWRTYIPRLLTDDPKQAVLPLGAIRRVARQFGDEMPTSKLAVYGKAGEQAPAVWSRFHEIEAASVSPWISRQLLGRYTKVLPTRSIDHILLMTVGLDDLPMDAANDLLKKLYDQLEEITGEALSVGLSRAQLEEFERIIDAEEDNLASAWLDVNRPNYRETVAAKFDEVLADLREAAPKIRAQFAEVAKLKCEPMEP